MAQPSPDPGSAVGPTAGVRVSVAIITYQHEGYLEACLRSVWAQRPLPDEIVLGVDASADRTSEVARRLAAQSPVPFKLLDDGQRHGMTANLERVLAACSGDIVLTFSGDDEFLPGKLAAQAGLLREDPTVAACGHDLEMFYEDGRPSELRGHKGPGFHSRFTEVVQFGMVTPGASMAFRRTALPRRLPDGLVGGSDWYLLLEAGLNGDVVHIPRTLGRYRRHDSNLSSSGTTRKDRIACLDALARAHPDRRPQIMERRNELLRLICLRAHQQGDSRTAAELARRLLRVRPVFGPFRQWVLVVLLAMSASRLLHKRRQRAKA